MDALPVARAKEVRDDGTIIEIVIWLLDQPLQPCTHLYKYRLYFGLGGECLVRYDNERGKGDHVHRSGVEAAYAFTTVAQLLDDFQRDVERWSPT